jgi:hypothetical protein
MALKGHRRVKITHNKHELLHMNAVPRQEAVMYALRRTGTKGETMNNITAV